ncbi:TPA: phage tail tape measure protein [Escherichia coli]|nr:phage tail tape measure protein [Escherichia coli]
MSDNNLRLQVILNAVDKLTRPFRSAQASSRELAAAVKKSRDAIKQLDQAGSSLDSFRKLQAENQKLGDRLNYARQRANLLSQELGAMGPPSQRQVVALGRQRLAVQRLEERQKKLQQQTALVRAELYRAGISAKDDAGATARLARETSRYNQELSKQEARLKRLGEAQRRMNAARASYARSLEVRDRIAGAGATTTAAGLAMGAPVMAAVKSFTSMEDAMKGVAKQVNGLRDDNGNRTARFYEMQDAIKAASEQLPMENGAVDFAALVEGGARMNVANPDDSWEDQKRDLLAFASTAAKAATAFELPADELSESLGKIAQLYKIPTRNIEQLGDALNYLDDNAMSKGADIIDVMQRLGGVADRLDYRKAAALGSTFLTLGAAPEVAASAANAMVRELSIATMQSKSFFEGMNLLKLNPEVIEKQMTKDAMGTIQRVLEKVNALPQDKRLSAMTMLFGKEFGDDAAKLANNLPELQRQLKLTAGNDALGSMQKESDINKDSLSAQWLLVKTGAQNTFSSLGETLRQPLMDILYTVKSVTGALRRWVEANPELTGTLMKASAVVAAVTVGLGTLAVALAAVLGPLAVIRLGFSVLGIKTLSSVITITRKDGDSHRFTLADRGAYTGVIASWLHTREPAKNESTTVKRKRRTKKQKKEPEAKQGDYLVGTDENVLVLNRTYANRSNAERAAKMQWERLQRGVASFSLQLAEGRADLYTEMPVKVSGFKQPIDDAEWTITTLTHTVSHDNGFTTSLELEVRIDDFEME